MYISQLINIRESEEIRKSAHHILILKEADRKKEKNAIDNLIEINWHQ